MRGTQAKKLRKFSGFKVGQLREYIKDTSTGQIRCTGLRRHYQRLKKEFNEEKKGRNIQFI